MPDSSSGHRARCVVPVKFTRLLPALVLALAGVWVAGAEPAATSPAAASAGHSAHGESYNEGPRSAAYLMGGTGNVHFPVTCKNAEAQKFFDQAIGQLHGFWYFESERSFRQVAAIDPDCAMAYWGMAMANINNSQRAREFIKEAVQRKKSAKLKPIETAWIDALAAFYQEPAKAKGDRNKNLVDALKEMRKQFSDDIELKAFIAFYIFEYHIKAEYPTADKMLDEIFAAVPNHPAHHYRIHLMDVRDPKAGLASAAQSGPASPGIAHMWHMPGHIYSDLQRYADAAYQQEASARVDHAYMVRDRVMPFQIFNYMHNNEWLCRDLLFVGRAHDAMDLSRNMIELPRHPSRGGGLFYGTARLIDTLSQHEMWEDYLAMCANGTLNDDLDADQLIRKLRFEGVADAALKHNDAADRIISRLDAQRKGLTAPATQRTDGTNRNETGPRRTPRRRKPGPQTLPSATQPAGAVAATTRPAAPPPMSPAERDSADRRAAIDRAIEHINAERAMVAGDYLKAAGLFTSAKARKEHIAMAYVAAQDFAKAEDLASQAVTEGKEQAYPLATQALVLHKAGKKAEAKKAFESLRKLAENIDLTVEPYKSLRAIATEYGYKSDYRIARKMPSDIGARPPLDSLGPFRWHPSPAPDWSARSSGDSTLSLSQYHGKPVVLFFYLGHGCPHCVRQIHDFAAMSKQFAAVGISLVAIGTDTPETLSQTWAADAANATPAFPLASDVSFDIFKKYHCYDAFEKMPLHGTFLIDGQGMIRWQDISYEPFLDATFLLKESKRLLNQGNGEEHKAGAT